MKMNGRSRSFCYLALSVSLLAACVFQPSLAGAQLTSMGVDCAQINVPSLMMQDNMRAGRILIECGIVQGGQPTAAGVARQAPAPPNIRVSNGSDCSGSADVCGSESMVAASTADKGQTIVVNYNAEFGTGASYTGTSYSTDGGATFKEIQPPPFATAHASTPGIRSWFSTPSWASSSPAIWWGAAAGWGSACGPLRMAKTGLLELAPITAAPTTASRCGQTTSQPAVRTAACLSRTTTTRQAAGRVDVFSLPTLTTACPRAPRSNSTLEPSSAMCRSPAHRAGPS
jgi:hypothetical protein